MISGSAARIEGVGNRILRTAPLNSWISLGTISNACANLRAICGRGSLLPSSICETVTRATPARSANVCCDICRRCRASRSVSIPTSPSLSLVPDRGAGARAIDPANRRLRSSQGNCKPRRHAVKRYTDGLFTNQSDIALWGKLLSLRTFTAYVLVDRFRAPNQTVVAWCCNARSNAPLAPVAQPVGPPVRHAVAPSAADGGVTAAIQ